MLRPSRILAAGGIAAVALAFAPFWASTASADFIYGIDDSNNIHEVNTSTQSSVEVYTNGTIPSGFSNAFAYDTARDQFFFIDSGNNLEFWSRSGNPTTLVTAADLDLTSNPQPQNAAYYNDAYWFFYENTNTLVQVPFTYVAGLPTVGSPATVNGFLLSQAGGGTGPSTWTNTFGDIAINANTGILYGATQSGVLFSVDLNGGNPSTATSIASGLPSLQLSFSSDYSTLYGQAFGGGQWYEVSTTTGATTPINGFITQFSGTDGLRDLGGAATTSVVPEIDPASFGSVLVLLLGALGLVERRTLRRLSPAGAV